MLFAGLLLVPALSAAQSDTTRRDTVGRPASRTAAAPIVEDGPLLDAPVSRTEYPLGPGDRLGIAVVGEFSETYHVTVTPEGSILIPGLGIARVLGLNLEQAENRVRALVERLYRNVEVRVALTRVRTFKVFLVGNTPNPGVRQASAATRVSEVVGFTAGEGLIRRNVTLRRTSGETVPVDLARFARTGDTSLNPFLRDGDVVMVPAGDERVDIHGSVFHTGAYEYRQGESLAEFLLIANGGVAFPASAADTIRLVRHEPEGRRIYPIARARAIGEEGRRFILRPFDAIYVPERSHANERHIAYVLGEVLRPGYYPIRPDTTTVRELVAMAGGFTPSASVANARLERSLRSRLVLDTTQVADVELTPDERRVRLAGTIGKNAGVVVDFARLFGSGGAAFDIPLRSGDLLTIPPRLGDVGVRGAVRTPGVIAYRTDLTLDQYIAAAGWYAKRADRGNVVVVRGASGARLEADDVGELLPGDIIIVPFREYRPWTAVLSTTQAIVTTITGIVLTAIAVF